jgi:hypothetical protein
VIDAVVPFGSMIAAYEGDDGDCIWSFDTPYGDYYSITSPSLVDYNGDYFLDVVVGLYPENPPLPGLLYILDGSPLNNHNMHYPDDRVLFEWHPISNGNWAVTSQEPCFAKTYNGELRIGMTYQDLDFPAFHFLYESIIPHCKFNNFGESQLQPWLMAYYNHRAEDNFWYIPPQYEEWQW